MKCLSFPIAIISLLAGCATQTTPGQNGAAPRSSVPTESSAQAALDSWNTGSSWVFIALDAGGKVDTSATFRITDHPANACLSGEWKTLEVVDGSEPMPRSPAYSLQGNTLQILLSTELCDAYDLFTGTLDAKGFNGIHRFEGLMASKEFGKVYGVYMTTSPADPRN